MRTNRARLTIVLVVPWEGPPINCQNFYHAVLTFEGSVRVGLNVTTTTKKVVNFWGKKSAPQRKKCMPTPRENPGYEYEKRAPQLTLGWGSPNG